MKSGQNRKKKMQMELWKGASLVGSGAFAQVYRVYDGSSDGFVACKITPKSENARWEAEILSKLQHPLFPRYIDSWEQSGSFFLFMEYVTGNTLRRIVTARGRLSQRQAVFIARELASGLQYLHDRPNPVIFRDLTPDNVLIRADGRIKLVDMGCACYLQKGAKGLAGSRGYSAPEQFITNAEIGIESDVYALGKLMYYMLTGEEQETILWNTKGFREKHCSRKLSRKMERLIRRAVEQDQKKRIPDMQVMLQMLSQFTERKSDFFYYERNVNMVKGNV